VCVVYEDSGIGPLGLLAYTNRICGAAVLVGGAGMLSSAKAGPSWGPSSRHASSCGDIMALCKI